MVKKMKYTETIRCKCGSSTVKKISGSIYQCLNCKTIFEWKYKEIDKK